MRLSARQRVHDDREPIKEVIFEHVDFCYPDGEEAVLKDISFSARAGQTTAINRKYRFRKEHIDPADPEIL